MTGTLFVLGIALLAAAFIGGGLKVSNVVEIPVISTRIGGFGLAFVGVAAIALGYQFHYWEIDSSPPAQPALTGSPPPDGSTPVPSSPMETAPAEPPDPSAFYSGTVRLDVTGLDFDLAPPRRVDGSNIQTLTSGELYTSSSTQMAQWDQQGQPGKAACAQQVDERGRNEVTGLTDGSFVCIRTAHGHIGRLDVRSVGSDVLTAHVTVWKD